jgi:hypothetical protein
MPQIWLTYEEAGRFFGCDAAAARLEVIDRGYSRRRSRDGQTRVKLTPDAAHEFMLRYAAGSWDAADGMVASLRGVLAESARTGKAA